MRRLLILVAAAALAAGDAADPLLNLPSLPRLRPVATGAPLVGLPAITLRGGVRVSPGVAVAFPGATLLDQGPRDGLEVIACLRDGKTHESFIRLQLEDGETAKAAMLAAFAPPDGQTAKEGAGQPARGTPMRVQIHWRDEDGAWRALDASSLVRDRIADRAYPPLPYIYTGSHDQEIPDVDAQGQPIRRRIFMLNNSKSLVTNFDEPDALLASPFPGARTDDRFEVASNAAPPPGTAVEVVITPAVLPLRLAADAQGGLSHAGAALDDAALGALLARHYGEGAQPALRAVGVVVERSTPREVDGEVRKRILAAAAAAKAWVVPVFELPPPAR